MLYSQIRYHLVHNNKKPYFKDLVEKDESVSIHHRNLRALAVEFFKVPKGLSPVIFAEAFPVRQQSQYNVRNYRLESLSCIGSKLWDSIPSHMNELDSINDFKHVIETWKPICAHADFVKFKHNIGYLYIYMYILYIIYMCIYIIYMFRNFVIPVFPFTLRCTFTFPCLVVC